MNRIRTQKDQWSAKSDAETASDTLESGSLPIENVAHKAVELEDNKPDTKEAEDVTDNTVLAGKFYPSASTGASSTHQNGDREEKGDGRPRVAKDGTARVTEKIGRGEASSRGRILQGTATNAGHQKRRDG
ncbi:unnamed protein product, partial [Staurois parvus]